MEMDKGFQTESLIVLKNTEKGLEKTSDDRCHENWSRPRKGTEGQHGR
jgi:hypothetical protein